MIRILSKLLYRQVIILNANNFQSWFNVFLSNIINYYIDTWFQALLQFNMAHSAGAVEYTDCISAEG